MANGQRSSDKLPIWDRTGTSPPRVPHAHGIPAGECRLGIAAKQIPPVRDFTDEEKKRVATVINVDLPYCLHGLAEECLGVHTDQLGLSTVLITHQHRPREAVEYVIDPSGQTRTGWPESKHVDLEDDAWGRTSHSRAIVTLPSYRPIFSDTSFGWGVFRDIGGYNAQVHGTQDDPFVVVKLLSRVCAVLNKVVTIYIAHTHRYEMRPLHPYDFLEFEACHRLDEEEFNRLKVWGLHNLVCESKERPFSNDAMASIRRNLKSNLFTMADEMLVAARRNLEIGERTAAITAAVTALETALSVFVTQRPRVEKANEPRPKYPREHLGVRHMLNILLPSAMTKEEEERLGIWGPLDEVTRQLNHVVDVRNETVHGRRSSIDERDAETCVADVSRFIDLLEMCKQ